MTNQQKSIVQMKKHKNNKTFGKKQEKKALKRWSKDKDFSNVKQSCNSGATFRDGDFKAGFRAEDYCIEFKSTRKNQYRVTSKRIHKIWNEALSVNKLPLFVVYFEEDDYEIIIDIERHVDNKIVKNKSFCLTVKLVDEVWHGDNRFQFEIKDIKENCIWRLMTEVKRR